MKFSLDVKNPVVAECWDDYARKYNMLAERMQLAGIEIKMLIDVVDAARAFEELKADSAFQTGITLGMKYAEKLASEEKAMNERAVN